MTHQTHNHVTGLTSSASKNKFLPFQIIWSIQVNVQEETEDAPDRKKTYLSNCKINPFSYLQPPPLVPDVRVDPSEKAEERELERPEDASIDIAPSPQGFPPLALIHSVRGKEIHLGKYILNNQQYVLTVEE